MPTVEFNGSATVDGTEQTLATITSSRTLMLIADLTGMAVGDRVVLRSKRKVLSGDASATLVQEREFVDVQSVLSFLDPVPSPHECVFTLERTAGALASANWSAESL